MIHRRHALLSSSSSSPLAKPAAPLRVARSSGLPMSFPSPSVAGWPDVPFQTHPMPPSEPLPVHTQSLPAAKGSSHLSLVRNSMHVWQVPLDAVVFVIAQFITFPPSLFTHFVSHSAPVHVEDAPQKMQPLPWDWDHAAPSFSIPHPADAWQSVSVMVGLLQLKQRLFDSLHTQPTCTLHVRLRQYAEQEMDPPSLPPGAGVVSPFHFQPGAAGDGVSGAIVFFCPGGLGVSGTIVERTCACQTHPKIGLYVQSPLQPASLNSEQALHFLLALSHAQLETLAPVQSPSGLPVQSPHCLPSAMTVVSLSMPHDLELSHSLCLTPEAVHVTHWKYGLPRYTQPGSLLQHPGLPSCAEHVFMFPPLVEVVAVVMVVPPPPLVVVPGRPPVVWVVPPPPVVQGPGGVLPFVQVHPQAALHEHFGSSGQDCSSKNSMHVLHDAPAYLQLLVMSHAPEFGRLEHFLHIFTPPSSILPHPSAAKQSVNVSCESSQSVHFLCVLS